MYRTKGEWTTRYKPLSVVTLPDFHSLLPLTSAPMTAALILPLDLIEEVINQAWNLDLLSSERILLMTSLSLVCKDVLNAYLRISSIYVHIPCPAYVEKFLQI